MRKHRDMAPTPSQLAAIRRSIRFTAARFHQWLSIDYIEDLMQEVLLRLWRSGKEDCLRDCPAYVRRVAENATIDILRRWSAKKRKTFHLQKLPPPVSARQPPRTPEEILIAREEAQQVIATSYYFRQRVRSTISQHFPEVGAGLE